MDVVTSKPIPGFPGYEATSDGRIISTAARNVKPIDREVKQQTRKDGSIVVAMTRDGRQVCFGVGRAVALAFHGPSQTGSMVVRHMDGNHANNSVKNVVWNIPGGGFRQHYASLPA